MFIENLRLTLGFLILLFQTLGKRLNKNMLFCLKIRYSCPNVKLSFYSKLCIEVSIVIFMKREAA